MAFESRPLFGRHENRVMQKLVHNNINKRVLSMELCAYCHIVAALSV